jgi:hypothetical protein
MQVRRGFADKTKNPEMGLKQRFSNALTRNAVDASLGHMLLIRIGIP